MAKIEMRQLKSLDDLYGWVRRSLGAPQVKVELTDDQIYDCVITALDLYLKWAMGQSSEEAFYVLQLEGGKAEYDLKDGILDIIEFNDTGYGENGINTLFTIQNQMYSAGMVDFRNLSQGLTLLSYHLSLDFMEVLERYTTSNFQWSYDSIDNKLFLDPAPDHSYRPITNKITGQQEMVDCPGWIILKVNQLIGAGRPGFNIQNAYAKLFAQRWVRFYVLALCKIVLGNIRRKFENFSSIGNTGISLDGSALLSEGKEEKEKLEEELYTRENWGVYPIMTGIV